MPEEIIIGDVKFWVEDHIIHGKIYSILEDNNISDIEKIFASAISTLSNVHHLPLLINMREMSDDNSIKAFNLISNSLLIKSMVLSKTFLVKSYRLKVVLSIRDFMCNTIVPNSVFKTYEAAIKECNRNYMMFNPLTLK